MSRLYSFATRVRAWLCLLFRAVLFPVPFLGGYCGFMNPLEATMPKNFCLHRSVQTPLAFIEKIFESDKSSRDQFVYFHGPSLATGRE